MIDNVILLITGTLHERDTRELLERCHPLGVFDSMPALCVATNVAELYNSVLVETPLAPYFKDCLSAEDLDEMNIEIIRNTLYKAYLEDFYSFSQTFGGPTAEIMAELLQVNKITLDNPGGIKATPEARSDAHTLNVLSQYFSLRRIVARLTSLSTRSAQS